MTQNRRQGVKKSIRNRILLRDGYVCQKCGRREHMNVHHIEAVMDGGTDEESNLITVCVACHREWELAEMTMDISFDVWLPCPSYAVLFASFRSLEKMGGETSAKGFHQTVTSMHEIYRAMKSSPFILHELQLERENNIA